MLVVVVVDRPPGSATHRHSCFGRTQAFSDVEALYTYEGTYDVNMLVAGRGITGISAIKPSSTGAAARGKH